MYIFQKNSNTNTTVTTVMVRKQNITVPSRAPYATLSNQIFPLPQCNCYANHYYQQAIITHMIRN